MLFVKTENNIVMKHNSYIFSFFASTILVLFTQQEAVAQFKLTVVEKMVQTEHPLPNITHDRLRHIL